MNESERPKIEYPCVWEYKVIGQDTDKMTQAVAQVIGLDAYSIAPSHESKGGKYVSLTVEIIVPDEAFRIRLFERLKAHTDIRMVL